jgi:LmbE family N-acetylglucosaminyl deacetylase
MPVRMLSPTVTTITARLALLLSIFSGAARAQRPPAQLDGAEILQRIHGLEVMGSVLYIAAHPDDENTRLISYLVNGRHARTAYLSLTRGDGGQNLIGSELGDALGIVRTQELLEARRLDGGEQFFTRAVDFGYSKSPEESFQKWGRQEILGDVVRVIRRFRPDVIITRFDTDGSGGHGHHTASAILAREAFDLAADAGAFPEQIAVGLAPWRTKRLYFNGSTWWRADLAEFAGKDPEHWVTLDVGGFDPLLGTSYTELAAKSRSQHKSQGFGTAETRGETLEYLRLDKGTRGASSDILDGLETNGLHGRNAERVQQLYGELVGGFRPDAPETSVPKMAELCRVFDAVAAADDPARACARAQADALRRLILQACGVVVEVTADAPRAAAGDKLAVTCSALQRRSGPVLAVDEWVGPGSIRVPVHKELAPNRALVGTCEYEILPEHAVDQPYWLARPHEGRFQVDSGAYAGIEPASRSSSVFTAIVRLADGLEIRVDRELSYKWVDRVAGERTRAVVITPEVSLRVVDPVVLVRAEGARMAVEIEALRDVASGRLEITPPAGFTLEETPAPIGPLKRGERRTQEVRLRRAADARGGTLRAAFLGATVTATGTLHTIDYAHIPPQTWYTPAVATLVPLDVAVDVGTVGYVDGAGDDVAGALRRLGIAVERIDAATARPEDLEKCDAIVTGIRAYNTVKELARFQPLLLAYVENGGTLVVQYNTNGGDLVIGAKQIGPRPFAISRDRVTVEETPPTFLAPAHPLMRAPNVIGAADFEGWVQERGLYFAAELDPAYTPLIAWNDPGEKPLSGALITCDHGKGRFVYTGLSLFRQLPAGVPGAYRLLANLVSRRTRRT